MADVESLNKFNKVKQSVSLPRIFDVFATVIVVTFIAISEFGWFPQIVRRGFYCDDRSIQRPYNGDTVTATMVVISGLLPLLLIWLTEAIFYSPSSIECTKADTRCSVSWRQAWYWFKKYGRGLLLKLLVVDALKIFAGEHRPHFLDTCRPDVICSGSEYISTYTCTNTDDRPYFIRDASKSFPSGHSSVSVYGVIFMIWYLQKRVPKTRSSTALPICQFTIGMWAFFCSLSRINDYRHHWWDVLAGSIIGVIAAVLTCFFGCHNFQSITRGSGIIKYKDHGINLIETNGHYKEDANLRNIVHTS